MNFLGLDERIKNKNVREFTKEALLYARDEFFWIPASSSGQYHPSYALGVGGLLRHTKACLVIAQELFNLHPMKKIQQDYIISALVLHDIEKPSKTHPVEVKLRLEPLRDKYPKVFDKVIPLIESHMGQWDQFGKLPRPANKLQDFVHMCDYLASRKELHIEV